MKIEIGWLWIRSYIRIRMKKYMYGNIIPKIDLSMHIHIKSVSQSQVLLMLLLNIIHLEKVRETLASFNSIDIWIYVYIYSLWMPFWINRESEREKVRDQLCVHCLNIYMFHSLMCIHSFIYWLFHSFYSYTHHLVIS